MAISPGVLTEAEYTSGITELLAAFEGFISKPRNIGDGEATVGYGYTFSRSNNLALWTESGIALTAAQRAVLAKIDAATTDANRTSIALSEFTKQLTKAEAKLLLGVSIADYEAYADRLGLPDSLEKIAVVSLTYNRGLDTMLTKATDFEAAVAAGNRAAAWFEIRYDMQTAKLAFQDGIAARRYVESEIFGLFDNDAGIPSETEALRLAEIYAANKPKILSYELKWDPAALTAPFDWALDQFGAEVGTFHFEARDSIALLSRKYAADLGIAVPVAEEFFAAHGSLVNLSGDGTSFDTGGRLNDLLIGNRANNILRGNAGDDIIAGGAGKDRLLGEGGNDILIGEAGTDRLEGGLGHDVFVFEGGGDRIVEVAGGGFDHAILRGGTKFAAAFIEDVSLDFLTTGEFTIIAPHLELLRLSPFGDIVKLAFNGTTPMASFINVFTGSGNDRVTLTHNDGWNGNESVSTFDFRDIGAGDKIDLSGSGIRRKVVSELVLGETANGIYLVGGDGSILIKDGEEVLDSFSPGDGDWQMVRVSGGAVVDNWGLRFISAFNEFQSANFII